MELINDHLRLLLSPEYGGSITHFQIPGPAGTWCDLMRPARAGTTSFNDMACYVLAPWSNRIAQARFTHEGREHRLVPNWPDGTAIHGDCKTRPFAILDRSPVSVRMALHSTPGPASNWPWAFECILRYELSEQTLIAQVTCINRDSSSFPCGLGFHPFWLRRLGPASDTCARIRVPVSGQYPCEAMIPSGPPRSTFTCEALQRGIEVDALVLDDVFLLDVAPHAATHAGPVGPSIEWHREHGAPHITARYGASREGTHSVIYCPRLDGPIAHLFCLEPVTMTNDGFNIRTQANADHWNDGIIVLSPGEAMHLTWTVTLSGIDPA